MSAKREWQVTMQSLGEIAASAVAAADRLAAQGKDHEAYLPALASGISLGTLAICERLEAILEALEPRRITLVDPNETVNPTDWHNEQVRARATAPGEYPVPE